MTRSRRPIVDLGVSEAYEILTKLGVSSLPPLDAIENEDWGRDFLLSKFQGLDPSLLAEHSLSLDDPAD